MVQLFRTTPVFPYQPVLYQLSIRAPNALYSELATYTFPLSPSSVRYDSSAASSFADVQGEPRTQGVTRYVDHYGLTPPVITIEGTTGYDRHLADGFLLTGLQSVMLLQQFLAQYASLNATQRQAGNPQLYTLEFSDYFLQQFWTIEPIGPQTIKQDAAKPILTQYRFRWAAIHLIGLTEFAGREVDALLQVFGTPAASAVINAATTLGAMTLAYSPAGPVNTLFNPV